MEIHALCESMRNIPLIFSRLLFLSMHDKSQDQSYSSSPTPMSPVKYPSLTDETDKKTFFPVTWRVIGGGVRMGVVKHDESVRSLVDMGGTSQHSVQKPPPLKIPVRRRSNSIPPTPSNVLINVEHVSF